jgi:hypothetical protein
LMGPPRGPGMGRTSRRALATSGLALCAIGCARAFIQPRGIPARLVQPTTGVTAPRAGLAEPLQHGLRQCCSPLFATVVSKQPVRAFPLKSMILAQLRADRPCGGCRVCRLRVLRGRSWVTLCCIWLRTSRICITGEQPVVNLSCSNEVLQCSLLCSGASALRIEYGVTTQRVAPVAFTSSSLGCSVHRALDGKPAQLKALFGPSSRWEGVPMAEQSGDVQVSPPPVGSSS